MRICVIGDGIAGRVLAHICLQRRWRFDIFGKRKCTACAVRPCGWGTNVNKFLSCLHELEMTPENYIIRYDSAIELNGKPVPSNLCSVDKPKFLDNLIPESMVRYESFDPDNQGKDYDLVVDCTGFSRAVIGPTDNDVAGPAYQHKVALKKSAVPKFDAIKSGYMWVIPLGNAVAHVGGGSTVIDAATLKERVREYAESMGDITCSCYSPLRLSGPLFPMVRDNVVAVGEAAGLVVPLSGEGIAPAMESILVLTDVVEYSKSLNEYERAIRKKFGWYAKARKYQKELDGGTVPITGLPTFRKAFKSAGIYPSLGAMLYVRSEIKKAN